MFSLLWGWPHERLKYVSDYLETELTVIHQSAFVGGFFFFLKKEVFIRNKCLQHLSTDRYDCTQICARISNLKIHHVSHIKRWHSKRSPLRNYHPACKTCIKNTLIRKVCFCSVSKIPPPTPPHCILRVMFVMYTEMHGDLQVKCLLLLCSFNQTAVPHSALQNIPVLYF